MSAKTYWTFSWYANLLDLYGNWYNYVPNTQKDITIHQSSMLDAELQVHKGRLDFPKAVKEFTVLAHVRNRHRT